MIGCGFGSASCAFIGYRLGNNNPKDAYEYYVSFMKIASLITLGTMVFVYLFRDHMIRAMTNIDSVHEEAMNAVWLLVIHTYPDIMKGMMKGPINALGIQYKAVYIHMFANWLVYPLAMWYFAFYRKMGIVGLWIGKISNEYLIFVMYLILL